MTDKTPEEEQPPAAPAAGEPPQTTPSEADGDRRPPEPLAPLADALSEAAEFEENVDVEVAYEVVQLLSAQLYSSPLKAIEELVVNSWDADARECRVYVPPPEELAAPTSKTTVAVLDNGHGMTLDSLRSLWHVGVSSKRNKEWEAKRERKQIGKFGIGKLATYVLANRITYITKSEGEPPRGVTLDFEAFKTATDAKGSVKPITLKMLRIDDVDALLGEERIKEVVSAFAAEGESLIDRLGTGKDAWDHWTLVVLEQLKEAAHAIRPGRLRWVLSTAMPAASNFGLRLNGDVVESSKLADRTFVVDFPVHEIAKERLETLARSTGEPWEVVDDKLQSPSFKQGVTGRVRVADRSLYSADAKSEDLGRSHGFFVRVLGRLVNEGDPLFGAKPLSFTTFYNLIAEVNADDLDSFITAPRDDLLQVDEKTKFRALLLELFREARSRYEEHVKEEDKKEREKREEARTYVNSRLVERPVADTLIHERTDEVSADWVLLETASTSDDAALEKLIEGLYDDSTEPRRKYAYRYRAAGSQEALVRFDPDGSVFWLNEDHDLVIANLEDPEARRLLEVFATAEAMLEVYLREVRVDPRIVTFLLERRDQLLRSLARDELYSLKAIAHGVRENKDVSKALEIAVVGALRALGFVARHISGSGTPDGEASFQVYGPENKSFTLETKASGEVPDLGTLDFAGLRQHYEDEGAVGCLLVAPNYPGRTQGNYSQVARRSQTQRVSCWTVEALARVVELAEARHITAETVQEIVFGTFTPDDVQERIDLLLCDPVWNKHQLYQAIIDKLAQLSTVMKSSPRNVSMVAALITQDEGFDGLEKEDVAQAAEEMAKASRGMLHIAKDETLHVAGSLEELQRRLEKFTAARASEPRRLGTWRNNSAE